MAGLVLSLAYDWLFDSFFLFFIYCDAALGPTDF